MRPTAFVRFVAFQVFQILNHHRPIRFCPMDKKSEKEKSKLRLLRPEKRKTKTKNVLRYQVGIEAFYWTIGYIFFVTLRVDRP